MNVNTFSIKIMLTSVINMQANKEIIMNTLENKKRMSSEQSEDIVSQKKEDLEFMVAFKKLFRSLISSQEDEILCLMNKIDKLSDEIQDIKNHYNTFNSQISILNDRVGRLLELKDILHAEEQNEYKEAIKNVWNINEQLKSSVASFASCDQLPILEMLVNFMCSGDNVLREQIEKRLTPRSPINSRIESIMGSIARFNEKKRNTLDSYLSQKNYNLAECLFRPSVSYFMNTEMTPFSGEEIVENTPVYVVSLGINFPYTNIEKELPHVIPQKSRGSHQQHDKSESYPSKSGSGEKPIEERAEPLHSKRVATDNILGHEDKTR